MADLTEHVQGCKDCVAVERLVTSRIYDYVKRGKGITLTKSETRIIFDMLEELNEYRVD